MNVVHRSYQMAIGTRGDIDTDIDIGAFSRYEEYEDDMVHMYLLLKNGLIRQSIPKVFMLIKKYVLLEKQCRDN